MSKIAGRFTLERELGSGGMATVYLGRDEVLDRPVAVKVLKSGFDGDIAERFQREGRTAASLSHPNLVQVYDAGEGELDGRSIPYIVMEHVSGGDLKSALDSGGPMHSERVARLGAGVSAGLAHAHERGVIHRDIKPHNILLDGSGSPKLTDFGIARVLDTTAMTVSGAYLGTALYSAPEQLKGEEITPKSDIYSLGAALYQAVTGEPPFSGSPLEVANQHSIREPGAPNARRSSGAPDPELDAMILSCLTKDPAKRPSAVGVTESLSRLTGNLRQGETGKGEDRRGKPRKPGAAVGSSRGKSGTGDAGTRVSGPKRRRRPLLRTFAGATVVALILVAGAAFAMMGGGSLQSPDVGSGVAGDQAAQNPQNGVGQSANGAGQDQVAPSNGGLNFGGSSPNQGSASAEAAAQTVRDVYELAAAGNYDSSYNLLSTGFRQGQVGSVDSWAGTFSTLESISFIEGPTAGVSGDTARVTGTTRAQHTDGTEFNRGTWTLVLENGEWRLDSVSIQKL